MKYLSALLILPFLLQAIGMFIDEFYFHHRRGLPRWERWGHPLDTSAVLACLSLVLLAPLTTFTLTLYFLLSAISILLVTKDEWVHNEHCSAGEQWIHSILFLLHPLLLLSAATLWPFVRVEQVTTLLSENFSAFTAGALLGLVDLGVGHFRPAVQYLRVHTLLTTLFLIYQILYWCWLGRHHPVVEIKRPQS